jgi:N-acetylneuraminic acid mutarotase
VHRRQRLAVTLVAGLAALAVGPAGGVAGAAALPATAAAVQSGRWATLRSALLERSEVSAALVGPWMYVVGGFGANARSTSAVERYDPRRGTWSLSMSLPRALNHTSAVGYRGSLYVVGGYAQAGDTSAGAVRDFWRFDPIADSWTKLPPAPIARAAAGAAVLGHRLYVAGGRSGTLGTIATTAIYDFDSGRWSLGPALHRAREHVAAVAAAGAIWLLGGRAPGQGNFAEVERLRPGARAWQRMRPMPLARSGFQAVAARGRIVVVGGEGSGTTFGRVDSLDPGSGRWTRLADLPQPRHGLGLVASGSLVYAVEGGPHPGLTTSRTVEALRVPD